MTKSIPQECLDTLFVKARTANGFIDRAVPPELLRQLYDLAKMGPTSMNSQPARYVFVTTPQSRERLLPSLSPGNRNKCLEAPVTVIVAADTRFYEHMPDIWHKPEALQTFLEKPALAESTAARNSTLGGAYFILAARALGLDCGPMSGFDAAKVDAEFFPDGRWRANFLITLGYGDDSKLFDRNPRLPFDTACRVI